MEELEEASQKPTPSKITKTRSTLHTRLDEIQQEITKFIDMPSTHFEVHAQHIDKKLTFIRTLLNAEIKSKGTKPYDLSEVKEKLKEVESRVEFYRPDLHPENVHEKSESGSDADSGSVCELGLDSDDDDSVSEAGSDIIPEKLYQVVVRPPPEVLYESTMMPCVDPDKVEMGGGGDRRRWRTVAVWTTVSAALMVSFCSYLVSNRDEDFLTPT